MDSTKYRQAVADLATTLARPDLFERIKADQLIDPAVLLELATSAKDEIMNLRAERTRARLDAEDEHFTTEDATTAALFPALPFLQRMADTYQERRGSYGASEQRFADIMLALFPDGLTLQTRSDWVRYGLFHQIISKLSRYVKNFHEPHVDSIHDIGPYSGMLEAEDRRTLGRPPFNFRLPDDHGD